MPSKGKKYGNASQVTTHVDSYRDGGRVRRKKKKSLGQAALEGAKMAGKAVVGATAAAGRKIADEVVTPALKKRGLQDGGKVEKKAPKKSKPDSKKPLSTADAMKNTRERQMKELGL